MARGRGHEEGLAVGGPARADAVEDGLAGLAEGEAAARVRRNHPGLHQRERLGDAGAAGGRGEGGEGRGDPVAVDADAAEEGVDDGACEVEAREGAVHEDDAAVADRGGEDGGGRAGDGVHGAPRAGATGDLADARRDVDARLLGVDDLQIRAGVSRYTGRKDFGQF